MKNKIIATIFLTVVFIFSGCDQLIYRVPVGQEAVITKNGKVVGDAKKPGTHFKIPYIQKVYYVKTKYIQINEIPVEGYKNISLKIFWKVDNAVTYFETNQKLNLEQNFETLVSKHVSKLLNLSEETKLAILNREYTTMTSEKLFGDLKKFFSAYGIRLDEVFILKDKSIAQQ